MKSEDAYRGGLFLRADLDVGRNAISASRNAIPTYMARPYLTLHFEFHRMNMTKSLEKSNL